MDMRTKLVFTLVGVALASMLAIGTFSYWSARDLILELRLAQLDGLAQTRQAAIEELFDGWRDRARLIASRTQLRASLDRYNRTGDPEARDTIERILTDAQESVTAVRSLGVFGDDDRLVVQIGATGGPPMPDSLPHLSGLQSTSMYRSNTWSRNGEVLLTFSAAMRLDDEIVGTLHMVLSPEGLAALAADHQGLGDTGETLITTDDGSGGTRILHPVRHPEAQSMDGPLATAGDELLAVALSGGPRVQTGSYLDYRGEPVWAATRYLEEPGWGLVVKVDEAEHVAPIRELRQDMTQLGITLAAFAILLGTVLGLQFARPIHDLARAAERISGGDLSTRVQIRGQDEVAALSRTFNQMTAGLERRVEELREFQTFFDRSLDLLCIASTDGYFKRVNPAFERVLGWSPRELLEKPFVEFVHPEDVETTVAEVAQLAEGRPTVSFENRYRRADGSYARLLWNTYPDPHSGLLYAIARAIPDAEGD
ncbi:MAG: HAMP domain-containing protein [Gemmatimonadetes bacterium]|nr:HAMP domain-containing protein [Gemmatimonadota bacterium]